VDVFVGRIEPQPPLLDLFSDRLEAFADCRQVRRADQPDPLQHLRVGQAPADVMFPQPLIHAQGLDELLRRLCRRPAESAVPARFGRIALFGAHKLRLLMDFAAMRRLSMHRALPQRLEHAKSRLIAYNPPVIVGQAF